MHKHINNIGRVIVNSLMLVLLIGVLALPISFISLSGFKVQSTEVLSAQDEKVSETSETTSVLEDGWQDVQEE